MLPQSRHSSRTANNNFGQLHQRTAPDPYRTSLERYDEQDNDARASRMVPVFYSSSMAVLNEMTEQYKLNKKNIDK